MIKSLLPALVGAIAVAFSGVSLADESTVNINVLTNGHNMGSILLSEYDDNGVVVTPNLKGLTPGLHGFHIYQNLDCSFATTNGEKVLGGATEGDFDPQQTAQHGFPGSDKGNEGDLPALFVAKDGTATHPVMIPDLELDDIKGQVIMLHADDDNYSDSPKPLGGDRVACGVIGK